MENLSELIFNSSDKIQSPYLLLDAAGSDGADGSAEGIHLRWDLLRTLGGNHIPKGNLAASGGLFASLNNTSFNKAEDFVQVFRAPYRRKYPAVINFATDKPDHVVESGTVRRWEFIKEIKGVEHTDISTTLILRFSDINKYDQIRATITPVLDPFSFIKQYSGVIELEASGKLSFAVTIRVKQETPAAGLTRVETISVAENLPSDPGFISIRKKFPFNSNDRLPEPEDFPIVDDTAFMQPHCIDEYNLMAENIRYVRFDYSNLYPVELRLETYSDFITGVSGQETEKWESVGANSGKYALSIDDNEVFERLESSVLQNVDQQWGRFRESDAPAPLGGQDAFKVKVQNYKDKWTKAGGLKEGVITYLQNSRDGSQAIVNVSSESDVNADPNLQDLSSYAFNYKEMLDFISLDYHVARMLGYGHIDSQDLVGNVGNRKYVYIAVYKTQVALEPGQGAANFTHYYMTLPTGRKDYKLPEKPVIKPLTFGLTYESGTADPIMLTDPNGYVRNERIRFINVNVEQKEQLPPVEPFFFVDNTIMFHFNSQTVYYGLEYQGKKDNNVDWEDYFRVPQLNVDNEFFDHNGNREVVPVVNAGEEKIFTHRETEPGFHRYGVYGINWFSRISDLSDLKETETDFTTVCTMIPPLNLAVQLIQEEEPRLFTTGIEQGKLQELVNTPGETDPTLVRVTFEINEVHHVNYQIGNKVRLFFRQNEPESIAGEILGDPLSLPGRKSEARTRPYTIVSDGSFQVNDPVITGADIDKYTGSIFATINQQFVIETITPDPTNSNRAKVVVKQIESRSSLETALNSNEFVPVQTFIAPRRDDRFLIVENLANLDRWEKHLAKEVDIVNLSPSFGTVSNSSSNNGNYTLLATQLSVRNTKVFVLESIPSATADGQFSFTRKVAGAGVDQAQKTFIVSGELTEEITVGSTVTIGESFGNDNSYTVASVLPNGDNTKVIVNENIPANSTKFSMSYTKTVDVLSVDQGAKTFTVKGDLVNEILLAHAEVGYNSDGSSDISTIGGLYAEATITSIPDVDANGVVIPGSQSGAFNIVFTNYNLADHPDVDVEWYKGSVRIPVIETDTRLLKVLEVIEIKRDPGTSTSVGPIQNPLHLVVYDPTFNQPEYPKIVADGSTPRTLLVNFHPGYRLYLKKEPGFDKTTILPAQGQGSKQTLMTAIIVDTINDCMSSISEPTLLYAKEIVVPEPPGVPSGPLFATRPDFYGKSTYTFDVEVNTVDRTPFALVFYRANSRTVLDTLYKQSTIQQILLDLSNLTSPDADFFTDRWNDLVNIVLDGNIFKEYTPGGYRFPNPDNGDLELVDLTNINNPPIKPFNSDGSTTPGSVLQYVKQAIDSSFTSLTENPLIYINIKDEAANGGRITRNVKPKIKDTNGEFIFPPHPLYDPHPMAVRFNDGITKVRFTDYTLEGSSNEIYFYYGVEMSDQLKFSDRSLIAGPIKLVDSFPADSPVIKKVTTQLANPLDNVLTAVKFEVDVYLKEQGIKKYQLYRAIDDVDALSVRTMKPVKEFLVDSDLINLVEIEDDFIDETIPPYGEVLYYRVVAMREIRNERNDPEMVPSQPSNLVVANIVDVFNPVAPDLSYDAEENLDFPRRLTNVIFSWNKTVHNGIYRLYKMSSSGNYALVAEVRSNDEVVTYEYTEDLVKVDEDGLEIFHRFKVDVENSSGLLNLESKELTI